MSDDMMSRFREFRFSLNLTYRLFLDHRVPLWTKAVPVLIVLYIFLPFDIIPDFLIVFGQIDEFIVLTLGIQLFERIIPSDVVAEHRYRLKQEQKSS
ncbi:MAG: YkvA family protein [Anaerolineae bacterium]